MTLQKKFGAITAGAQERTKNYKTQQGAEAEEVIALQNDQLSADNRELREQIARLESRIKAGEGAENVKDLLTRIETLQRQIGHSELDISQVHEKPGANRRRNLTDKQKAILRENLREYGQIHAIVVEPAEEGGYYIIAGHNRVECLKDLGRPTVRAEMRVASEQQPDADVAAIISNAIAPEVSTFDLFVSVKTLVESKGMKQQDAAAAIGRTPSFVSKILKLSDAHPLFLEHLKTTGQFLSAGQILAIEDRIKATVSEQEIQQVIQGLSQDQKAGNKEKKTTISVSESAREEPKKPLGNKRIDRFEIKHTGKPVTATSRGAVLTINFGSDARLEILSAQIRDLIEKSLGSELVGKKP